jgi:hypothetical protein
MTAQELYDQIVLNMGIAPADAGAYDTIILGQINAILAQTFSLENNNRAFKGLTELTVIPTISALSDVLTYQDNVLRNVVSWGVSQLLALTGEEYTKASAYSQIYNDNYAKERKFIAEDPTDYYGDDE